jgi:hypothetical protein
MRIHVALDQPLDKPLPTGARATVQLYNSDGPFARTFAGLQIHLTVARAPVGSGLSSG